jgi:hypothetical protein
MKLFRLLAVLIAAASIFAVSAGAQQRKPVKRKPVPKPKVTVTNTLPSAADTPSAKEKVSNQIKNLTRFIGILGPVAQNIENTDRDARNRSVDRKILDQNEANKKKVIIAIQNLHAGLSALENDFETKPPLRKFLLKITGISALGAQAESLASAGSFSESRKPLQSAIDKLSDTLAIMP